MLVAAHTGTHHRRDAVREFRYFSQDETVSYAGFMPRAQAAAMLPEGYRAVRVDSFSVIAGKTTDGRIVPVTRQVRFARVARPQPCGGKCRAAKGPDCSCACGGASHGAGC